MHPTLAGFVRAHRDTPAMAAAALRILADIAADDDKRHRVASPWAWDLRQRARRFERSGHAAAAGRARSIARTVAAVALGELPADTLRCASESISANRQEVESAFSLLTAAMEREIEGVAS